MSRYIDAQKLIAWCNETYQAQSTVQGKVYINALLTEVLSCPTADVVEVRHGEWIEKPNPWEQDGSHTYVCSVCNEQISILGNALPYCSFCGAKMEKKRRKKERSENGKS